MVKLYGAGALVYNQHLKLLNKCRKQERITGHPIY